MADLERRLDADLIGVEGIDTVASRAAASIRRGPRSAVSILLLRDGVVGAAEELGEQAGETEADRRHARADDADLALEHRPQTGLEVVPCHVCRVCKVHEGAQAEHGDDGDAGGWVLAGCRCDGLGGWGGIGNIQGTDTEHEQDTNLLLHGEMQVPDLRDGKRERDEVEEDAEGGVGEGQRVVVDALARVFAVPLLPGIADGRADEDGGEGKGESRGQAEDDDGPDDAAEALLREDLQVEEQEGDLDESKG